MFPQIFGKYVLEREIAAGGMARVLLATLRGAGGFEKRLVVKQIRPELASDQSFIGRFVAEAKVAVELSHANIVPVYELGVEQGTYFIAMEFCEGAALSQLLASGPLTPAEGAYIGVEICRALDYAHRKAGIVHRDVTPRNVMVDPEGMVRLIDFGIAAPVDLDTSVSRVSGRPLEPLFGSPGHMPPEQLRRGPLTPAADVFAVGALLVEAWTGNAPFRRETFEASLRALSEPRIDLAQVAPELASLAPLVRSVLAAEPSERPQTAEELARPLREFLRQTDLGDIAKQLGERVSARLTRPPEPQPGGSRDRSLRSTGSGATQTFAARGALLEWTAKIDSQPPAEPAVSPISGVVIESGALPGGNRRTPSGSARFEPGARRRLIALSLGLGGAFAAVWLLGRALDPGRRSAAAHAQQPAAAQPAGDALALAAPVGAVPAAPAPGPAPLRAPAVPAPALRAPAAPAPALPASELPRAPATERSAPAAHVQPAAVPASAVRARIRIQVTAQPPALVQIDGAAAGRTPLSGLAASPGEHTFVFVSELLGERLEAKLKLGASEGQRIHADFTSAAPQVYQR